MSDESLYECLKVYSDQVLSLTIILLVIVASAIYLLYLIKNQILIVKCYGKSKLLDMHIKAAHQNEDGEILHMDKIY